MALVRLTDVIVPEVFNAYLSKDVTTKPDVFRSGLVTQDAMISGLLAGGGRTFQHPYWGDLSDTGSAVGSDDPGVTLTPEKIGTFKLQFVRQFRTKAWSSADLVKELAGSDPMQRIVSRIGDWWARDMNILAIQTLNGVINANIAQNAGDMVYSAGVGVGGATPTAALTATAILNAKQTMGDRADLLKIIMMHSVVFTNLQLQNLITFIPNARGEVNIPTYLGYQVVMSDTLPITGSSPNFVYTTYLAAPGILGYGESAPDMPVEVDRKPAQGNGTGVEEIYTRRQFALHPYGFHWADSSIAGTFPTNAELATAANWNRRFPERKHVPFVAIKSLNG